MQDQLLQTSVCRAMRTLDQHKDQIVRNNSNEKSRAFIADYKYTNSPHPSVSHHPFVHPPIIKNYLLPPHIPFISSHPPSERAQRSKRKQQKQQIIKGDPGNIHHQSESKIVTPPLSYQPFISVNPFSTHATRLIQKRRLCDNSLLTATSLAIYGRVLD